MQIVRTIIWVVILAALLIFTAFNWRSVEVQIWTNMVLETKIPALVIVAFLLGLVPTWLIHRGIKWRLQRRIDGLEAAARSNAGAKAAAMPAVVETTAPAAPTRPGDGVEAAPDAPIRPQTANPVEPEPISPVSTISSAKPSYDPDATPTV